MHPADAAPRMATWRRNEAKWHLCDLARAPTRPVCKLSFRDDATGFADSHFPLPEGPLLPLKSDEASTFGDA